MGGEEGGKEIFKLKGLRRDTEGNKAGAWASPRNRALFLPPLQRDRRAGRGRPNSAHSSLGRRNESRCTCLHNTPVLLSGFVQLKAPVSMGALTNKHISGKHSLLQVPTSSFLYLPAFPPTRSAPDPQEPGLSQPCLVPAATSSPRHRAEA